MHLNFLFVRILCCYSPFYEPSLNKKIKPIHLKKSFYARATHLNCFILKTFYALYFRESRRSRVYSHLNEQIEEEFQLKTFSAPHYEYLTIWLGIYW